MLAVAYVQLLKDMRNKGYDHPDINSKLNSMTIDQLKIFCIYETGDIRYHGAQRQIVDLFYQAYEKKFGVL
jgi:hypothetical protein